MATVDQAVRELTSGAAYLQSHVALNAADFDINGCRVAAVRGIVTVINSVAEITTDDATRLLNVLPTTCFTDAEKSTITAAIDAKKQTAQIAPVSNKTKQTFETADASQHYYNALDWATFENPSITWEMKAWTALSRLSKVGFKNIGETTAADIATAIGEAIWPNHSATPLQMFDLSTHIKVTSKIVPLNGAQLPFMSVYPSRPLDLPGAIFQHAYSNGQPIDGKCIDWNARHKGYSCRGTNKNVREEVAKRGGRAGTYAKQQPTPSPAPRLNVGTSHALCVPGSSAAPSVRNIECPNIPGMDRASTSELGMSLLTQGVQPNQLEKMLRTLATQRQSSPPPAAAGAGAACPITLSITRSPSGSSLGSPPPHGPSSPQRGLDSPSQIRSNRCSGALYPPNWMTIWTGSRCQPKRWKSQRNTIRWLLLGSTGIESPLR